MERLKKYILVIIDVLLLAYLALAITVFNNPDESRKTCREVTITIADENTNGFLDVKEIKSLLMKQNMYPLNKKMQSIEPRQIEEMLTSSPFINTAECHKSKDSLVSITVTQRLPVVRIKGNDGGDYYLDVNGGVVPNANYHSDLIIATGTFSKKFAMQSLALLAELLTDDDFWNAQIEQINVTEEGGIELVPRVGEHVVYLGPLPQDTDKEMQEEKIRDYVKNRLHRLELFYRYGLPQTGWNKYGFINLEYEGQIICKKEKGTVVDDSEEQINNEIMAQEGINPEAINN
ncbi:MAG: cell division protein FtsQ [Bacteroidaceae bacterium]|nr:cell division protein FtsQ [Bacteroidaceae bacterium]